MKKMLFVIMSLVALDVSAESSISPAGLWETFDDDGHLESTVEVRVDDGSLFANIVMLHNSVEENPVCDKCKGDLFGKPVIGMQVFDGLTLKRGIWQKGTVFDPKTGDTYKGKVWLDGEMLLVRGYVGFVYKTKVWRRTL